MAGFARPARAGETSAVSPRGQDSAPSTFAKLRGHRVPWAQRADSLLRRLEHRAVASGRRRARIPFYLARVLLQVVRQWIRDRCPQQAASLAFQTVLSIVPILAVATAALRALGHFNAQSSFVNFIADNLIPVSREEISQNLVHFSQNITFESVGLVGLVTTTLLAFVMFNNLESIINFVWRAERGRSVTQKFVVFYFSMTVGPLLLGMSLVEAARFGLTSGLGGVLLGLASSFAVLLLANLFLPIPKVRLVPALIGAGLTTILFEVAKLAFSAYVSRFALSSYSGIYGAVAVFPLWLVWIYYSWLTLLLGVEVAHAVQNLATLEHMDQVGAIPLESEILRRVNGVVAARLMGAVAEAYAHDEKALSRRALADRFDLSDEVVDRLVERLESANLVMEVHQDDLHGVAPARPLEHITLADVLGEFESEDLPEREGEPTSKLDAMLSGLERDTHERTSSVTFADLVMDESPAPSSANQDKTL